MPYSSISVTFEWWEHRPSVAWEHHTVIRKVPLRKTRVAQSRVVERYFLKLLARRVVLVIKPPVLGDSEIAVKSMQEFLADVANLAPRFLKMRDYVKALR